MVLQSNQVITFLSFRAGLVKEEFSFFVPLFSVPSRSFSCDVMLVSVLSPVLFVSSTSTSSSLSSS